MPAELADWPVCTLGEAQLGDLELLTSGAFAPLSGFMDAAEVAAVTERGMLADGTPWPVPVILVAGGLTAIFVTPLWWILIGRALISH